MAGFLSLCFSVLYCVPQYLIKERHSKISALCKMPRLAPRKTESKLLAIDSTNTEIFSVNWSHHRCLTTTSKQLGEIFTRCLDVICDLFKKIYVALGIYILGHTAICNSVALASAELLKLTWTTHDFLAFCHGKWVHQMK